MWQEDVAYLAETTNLDQLRQAIEAVGYQTEAQPSDEAPVDAE